MPDARKPNRPLDPGFLSFSRWFVRIVPWITILISALILLGWSTYNYWMVSLSPRFPPMAPISAMTLIIASLAVWLQRYDRSVHFGKKPSASTLPRVLSLLVILSGLTTLLGYILESPILELPLTVFTEPHQERLPVRPSPETAIGFLMFGLSTLLTDARQRLIPTLAQVLALIPLLLSIVVLTGYIAGDPEFYSFISRTTQAGMAFSTAITFLLLSLSALLNRADRPFISLLASATSGGVMARRLVAALVLIPPLVGILSMIAIAEEAMSPVQRSAFASVLTAAAFLVLTWATARRLESTEIERNRLESQQQLLAQAGEILLKSQDYSMLTGRISDILIPRLADWCLVCRSDPRAPPRIEIARHKDPSVHENLNHSIFACATSRDGLYARIQDVIRSGSPARLSSTDSDLGSLLRDFPSLRGRERTSEMLILPLLYRGASVGALILGRASSDRPFDRSEIDFLTHLAQRIALSLENAALLESTRQAVRARESVLSFVSHDLKGPLTTSMLHATALHRIQCSDTRQQHQLERAAQGIEKAGRRMSRLIEDLLDFARMEQGRLSIRLEDFPVSSLFDEIADTFAPLAERKGLSLIREGSVDQVVTADRHQLVRVLANLVDNAIKFTPEGGQITLRAIDLTDCLRFEVEDTGGGIPDHALPHLFDRFWQAEHHTGAGSGLGLAIAKAIVEAHAGRIGVRSALRQGSLFYCEIPKTPSAYGTSAKSA